MMPMGIHHIFAGGHHYGPEPWYAPRGVRVDWTPPYYHKADANGMGFDRTTKGSNNVSQYPKKLAKLFNNVNTCPEKYLLWFHVSFLFGFCCKGKEKIKKLIIKE